ncbi:DUF397 domain-containing protein [Streptomyces sp. NPDC007100]|uniref:DUF397 domain-containing protein n=1 Tax=Streptomyces sp. NPDC007100 TaxID=3155602 RepID=UPI0033DE950A
MKSGKHVISNASVLTAWRKSSHSGGGEGDCLEVSDALPGLVPVRDSKNPDGPALVFSDAAFASFVGAVRHTGGHGRFSVSTVH